MATISVRGRLVEDAVEDKVGDTDLCKFRFRSDEYKKKKSPTPQDSEYIDQGNFFDVTVWRRDIIESVARLKKGDRVVIQGRLVTHHWQDKDDNKRSELQITADDVNPFIGDLEEIVFKSRKTVLSKTEAVA